jgi:hypothetical protein
MNKLVLLILISFQFLASANNKELITEMESLRKTLKPGTETRLELTRRLADLYYQDAVEVQKNNVLKGQTEATPEVAKYRQRAFELYSQSLKGTKSLSQKILIQFQLARILEAQEKKKEASQIFQNILANKQTPQSIRKETAIKVAEYFDDQYEDNKAKKYYKMAISMCDDVDLCGYANYKYAWVLYRNGDISSAANAMKKSLFNKQGDVQEKSLADYIVFLSNQKTDGVKELAEIQTLATKLKRPDLVRELGETFYTSGNRKAGTHILTYLNEKNPDVYYTVRLAEENYGFRNWEKFRSYLKTMASLNPESLPKDQSKYKEVKGIVKRMALQLDGEVKSDPTKKNDLQSIIDIYLSYYPNDELRTKMVDGWLNVEDDKARKINRLKEYISFAQTNKQTKEEIRLRRMRLSLAQKVKNTEVILVEADALSKKLEKEDERRQFTYLFAQTKYKQNKIDEALPIFKSLAVIQEGAKPDKWATLSQNLALDILNQKKDYKGILAQASTWTSRADLAGDKKVAKEINEMKKVSLQAEFEDAFSLGQTEEALKVFEKFCYSKQFVKKSCPNVKVLAVKLQKQDSIIKILEHNKDEKSLMVEYERMGRFSDAAKLQEKFVLNKKSALPDYLKIALLYELDNNLENRDRILNKMIKKIKKDKKIDEKLEPLVYSTLVEAGYFDYKLVSLPWKMTRKMRMVEELENRGIGNKLTKKMFLTSSQNMGALWEANKVQPLIKLNQAQAKQGFYGRYQKTRFKRRVAKLKKFADEAKKVLEITTPVARVYVSNMLAEAYLKLAMEIESMPIPKVIEDQAQRDQIKQNLITMAEPFKKESEGYRTVFDKQMAEITDLEVQDKVSMNLDKSVKEYFNLFVKSDYKDYKKDVASLNKAAIEKDLNLLKNEPENTTALNNLINFYKNNKHERLSAYYQGRLLSLNSGGNQ